MRRHPFGCQGGGYHYSGRIVGTSYDELEGGKERIGKNDYLRFIARRSNQGW
jgi:hypothetical protein